MLESPALLVAKLDLDKLFAEKRLLAEAPVLLGEPSV
jgi:hypothetical protein